MGDAKSQNAETQNAESQSETTRAGRCVLLLSVFVVGGCGLLYELVTGAAASYLVGDTVTQYSLVIGVFLASMGLGAWATQWIRNNLLDWFVIIQLVIAVVGGFSAIILFMSFAIFVDITPIVLTITAACGTLVGMEIPLVLRVFKGDQSLRTSVAHVLTLDYLGALVASILFPFVLLPMLSLVRAALAAGSFNGLVALLGTLFFWRELRAKKTILFCHVASWALLIAGWIFADSTTTFLENRLYPDEIVYAETTPYQRMVVTRRATNDDVRLHLEGHLQFSSTDEHRYHEALVLPALASASNPKHVLILGGGDGLAIRTLLKSEAGQSIEHVDLVDLDPRVVDLFRTNEMLVQLNDSSLHDPRVNVINDDAFSFLRKTKNKYDVIIADLPDPSNIKVNKLYSVTFFRLALSHLEAEGTFVTQATSPWYARQTFWCIATTVESAIEKSKSPSPRQLVPYHIEVPSFGGDWGFVMVTAQKTNLDTIQLDQANQFLTPETFAAARSFPIDSSRMETSVNTLVDPVLVRYHSSNWSQWYE